MDCQDWTHVTFSKSKRAAGSAAGSGYTGAKQILERKSGEGQHIAKIDREELPKAKMLSSESRQELIQRRLALKLSQVQLDQQCAFPPHTVNALEANKRAPSSKELQVLNRILKCGLKLS